MSNPKNSFNPLALEPSSKPLNEMSDDEFFDHIENNDTADHWDELEEVEDVSINHPVRSDAKT